MRHDIDTRKSSFEKIIEHVRLPYCRTNYLRHMKYTGDLMTPRCFEYLHKATLFQADTVHQHEMTSCRTLPRTNVRMKSCLLVVGGLTCVQGQNDKVVKDCQYYREDTSCWALLTELPQSVDRLYDVCRVDRGLLLTGGTKSGVVMDKCWLFDLATKKWQATTPLITARWYHRSVSLDDCVYVVGGKGVGHNVLASIECLNVKRQQWSSLPEMSKAVFAPAVVTYSNKIFVFGGRYAQNKDLCLRRHCASGELCQTCLKCVALVLLSQ